jgi:hypothetical protein
MNDPLAPFVRAGRWIAIAGMVWLTLRFAAAPLAATPGSAAASFLHLPNLIFHEAGHVIFMPFGRFMTVLGGSLFQILVPLICAVTFARQQGNWFACAVMIWWAGENFVDVAPYIADARKLQMTLIGGRTGAEVEGHDWEYLLTAMGSLHRDLQFGRAAHIFGIVVMVGAIAWAVSLVLRGKERADV